MTERAEALEGVQTSGGKAGMQERKERLRGAPLPLFLIAWLVHETVRITGYVVCLLRRHVMGSTEYNI